MTTERKDYQVGDVIQEKFRLKEMIGEGVIGTVFLAEDVDQTFIKYAIKRLDRSKMDGIDIDDYKREIAIMKKLSGHPNIVQYITHLETDNYYYLAMEYCETDLFDAIFLRCGLPTPLVKRFFSDIAQGLSDAHNKGIYHRDIKPENVLVTGDGGVAKLADFGLSTFEKYTYDFGVGSTRYMAPECYGPEKGECDTGEDNEVYCYNAASADIWSLGILLLNMIIGRCPWNQAVTSDRIFRAYIFTDPHILKKQLKLSEKLDNFLKENVFNLDPEKRCDVEAFNAFVSTQEYFISLDNDKVLRQMEYRLDGGQVTLVHQYDSENINDISDDNAKLSFLQMRGSVLDASIQESINSNLYWSATGQLGSINIPNRLTISSLDRIASPFLETNESRVQLAKQLFRKSIASLAGTNEIRCDSSTNLDLYHDNLTVAQKIAIN